MQNKRGISQVFGGAFGQQGVLMRSATVFDVFDISRVLITSITALCAEDHGGDPAKLAPWLANKAPEDFRQSITAGNQFQVAEVGGAIRAVGLTQKDGFISLLYVAPDAIGTGLGRKLLSHLEQQLHQQGHDAAHLVSTQSALKFYLSQGWVCTGLPTNCFGLPGHPMRKLLQSAG